MSSEGTQLIRYSKSSLVFSGASAQENKHFKISDYAAMKNPSADNLTALVLYIDQVEQNATIEEILSTIIGPRVFRIDNQVWMQTPVSFPATNRDTVNLAQDLRNVLASLQAKEDGICDVRLDTHFQVLDEIIRQVTINYKTRGILLACLRDFYKSLFKCYRELYISTVSFGIRMEVQGEKKKAEIREKVVKLKEGNSTLRKEVEALRGKISAKQSELEAKRVEKEQVRLAKVKELHQVREQLKEELVS